MEFWALSYVVKRDENYEAVSDGIYSSEEAAKERHDELLLMENVVDVDYRFYILDYSRWWYWAHSSAGERLLCKQDVGGSIPSGSTKV